MTGLLALLTHPGRFFAAFSQTRPNWPAAYLGYCLITLAGSLGAWNAATAGADSGSAMLNGLLRVVLDGAFSMVFFGIVWMYFGSRLVMGQTSLARTVQAVGYAFLWPGLVGTLALLLPVSAPGAGTFPAFASLALRLVAGLWAIAQASLALKVLNNLDWRRTAIAVLWLPLTLTVLAAGSIILARGASPVP